MNCAEMNREDRQAPMRIYARTRWLAGSGVLALLKNRTRMTRIKLINADKICKNQLFRRSALWALRPFSSPVAQRSVWRALLFFLAATIALAGCQGEAPFSPAAAGEPLATVNAVGLPATSTPTPRASDPPLFPTPDVDLMDRSIYTVDSPTPSQGETP